MREHEINKLNNFIMGWYLDDTSYCDKLIQIFNNHINDADDGVFYNTDIDNYATDLSTKESKDLCFSAESFESLTYGNIIKQCNTFYFEKYDRSLCNGVYPVEGFNIQYYNIGGGYKKWHSERAFANYPIIARHLVFMTYLNDVSDGGTEFMYQNITIKAEKGLTLIWPADWTFTHRGQISQSKEKWIATGWLHLSGTKK